MPPLKGAGQKYISLGKSHLAEGFVFQKGDFQEIFGAENQ